MSWEVVHQWKIPFNLFRNLIYSKNRRNTSIHFIACFQIKLKVWIVVKLIIEFQLLYDWLSKRWAMKLISFWMCLVLKTIYFLLTWLNFSFIILRSLHIILLTIFLNVTINLNKWKLFLLIVNLIFSIICLMLWFTPFKINKCHIHP